MRLLLTGLLLLALAPPVSAQRNRANQGGSSDAPLPNVLYDGRFTFVRVKFEVGLNDFRGGRDLKWDHDYPRAERHFTKILEQLTTIQPRVDASNILALDDPALFKFPIAYLCEPGFWQPTDKEVAGVRAYLQKGGLLIIDDFVGNQIFNLENQLRRILPGARMLALTKEHPLFDAFYRIESLDYQHPYFGQPSVFFGVFEDNDPTKRLLMIINYNNDIGEYWEWSDTGAFAIDLSNEAYKIGVNYIVYALTR
jgi:hypothetical protein